MDTREYKGCNNVLWVSLEDQSGGERLATLNLTPGRKVYGERLIQVSGKEYRVWDTYRSKLAAAITKGVEKVPLEQGSRVLYLGAASGTTASHVSDIVGEDGLVYCVEFSPRVIRELVALCEYRKNMLPILADARFPEKYRMLVDQVDLVYQDVAQPNQSEIMTKNAKMFLKEGGHGFLAIKARSVDVTKEPSEIFKRETETLRLMFEVKQVVHLEPYDKAHVMIVF
ncbi:MAG: fibrillarin-like rRNA/tRNA 2'-O-methyltransferase [Promethearchaeati archaeon SRVP18_Atabeyarchaeia-1]